MAIDIIRKLLDRWEQLRLQGREMSLEELCRDQPHLLPDLEQEVQKRLNEMDALLGISATAKEESPTSPTSFLVPATISNVSVGSPTVPIEASASFFDPAFFPKIPGYEILGVLGQGGMGIVFKARQVALKRIVALKMITAGGRVSRDQRVRFRAEAEAVARFQHPHIVQVYQVGEHEGCPFFSMEFVEGGSLDKRMDGQPLQPRKAAELIETLARAMHYAHERGIVHRDLKPANVLLTTGKMFPKITDFGLARQLDRDVRLTQSGTIMGTPSYMAPEQAGGKTNDIGPCTDVYALGTMLYEMLTGKVPFKGTSTVDTILQVLSQEPVSPRRLTPKVPRDLEAICLKCLEKTPAKRYGSAEALADDLKRFLVAEPIRARHTSKLERTVKWVARRPVASALIVSVFFLVILSTGILWHIRTDKGMLRLEMDDPAAPVEVHIDGELINPTLVSSVFPLQAGSHELVVSGKDYARISKKFVVARGELLSLPIHLEAVGAVTVQAENSEGIIDLETAGYEVRVDDDDDFDLTRLRVGGHRLRIEDGEIEPVNEAFLVRRGEITALKVPIYSRGEKNGLKVELHRGREFKEKVKEGIDPYIDWLWGYDAPDKSVKERDFSIRWTGYIKPPLPGAYELTVISANGVRLEFDGRKVIDEWKDPLGRRHTVSVELGDKPHSLLLESYGVAKNSAIVSFRWKQKGATDEHVVPREALFHDLSVARNAKVTILPPADAKAGNGLNVELFSGRNFGKRIKKKSDSNVDWLWGYEAADPELPTENYSIKWNGWLVAPKAGRYKLTLIADGGVRLSLDDAKWTLDRWKVSTARRHTSEVELKDRPHSIKIEYSQGTGPALISLRWEQIGGFPEQIVPTISLFQDKASAAAIAALWHNTDVTFGEIRHFQGHSDTILSLAFDPAGTHIVSASADGTLRLWDVNTSNEVRRFVGHVGKVEFAAFSFDGKNILSGGADKILRWWDVATGKELKRFQGHTKPILSGAISPDGRFVASGGERTFRLWDLKNGGEVWTKAIFRTKGIAFSPKGDRILAGGSNWRLRLWETESGRRLLDAQAGDRQWVRGVAFTTDGLNALSTSGDTTVRLWDLEKGKEVKKFTGHRGEVWSVAVFPDGRRAITGGADKLLIIWDIKTGKELHRLPGHTDSIAAVAVSPDGRFAVSGGKGKTIKLWNLPP